MDSLKLPVKHSSGPWSVPHFADPTIRCNCTFVFCEAYMGSIATVQFSNGLPLEEGGGDDPPLEEAIKNAYLIATAPELLYLAKQMLLMMRRHVQDLKDEEILYRLAEITVARAEGE